jgi:hypothetical protein
MNPERDRFGAEELRNAKARREKDGSFHEWYTLKVGLHSATALLIFQEILTSM